MILVLLLQTVMGEKVDDEDDDEGGEELAKGELRHGNTEQRRPSNASLTKLDLGLQLDRELLRIDVYKKCKQM